MTDARELREALTSLVRQYHAQNVNADERSHRLVHRPGSHLNCDDHFCRATTAALWEADYPRAPFCCNIECDETAEYEIWTHRGGGALAGPDPYSDYTQACETHVGSLLGHQPDAPNSNEIVWTVYALDRGGQGLVRIQESSEPEPDTRSRDDHPY